MPDPSPRISALIVARDEAENLPGCLQSLGWVDESVVVVDAASRDRTESIARSMASKVVVRVFDDFAHQRNAALSMATGDWVFAVDADERATPALAAEIRLAISDPIASHAGYRVPIRSVVLGRPFRFSGTQHDLPLRLFRRGLGRWVGTVHETVDLEGSAGRLDGHLTHRTIPDMHTFLRKIDHYTTLEALKFQGEGRTFRAVDVTLRPLWAFAKLYLGKQGFRDGLEGLAFCALSGLSVAVRHWKHRELIRAETTTRDAYVAARFDESEARFKGEVAADDVRLRAVLAALVPLEGLRVLDLGCGKGRFAAHLRAAGAEVVGLDVSSAMLARATGLDRVRASARRLPFADATFDAVVAVEVLEHVGAVEPVLNEARRVLRPGGRIAIVDKNAGALDARRPWLPSLAIKWVDERRGLWMYPAGAPVREHWFGPRSLRRGLDREFTGAEVEFLLRPEEARRRVFRWFPAARLLALWTARMPEDSPDVLRSPPKGREARRPRGLRGSGSLQGCPAGRTTTESDGSCWPLEDHPGTGGDRP